MGQIILTVKNGSGFYTTKVSNLTVSNALYTTGTSGNENGTIVFTFSSSPDLSKVMIGSLLHVDSPDEENSGIFEISAVDNSTKKITVISNRGLTNASATGKAFVEPFRYAEKLECTYSTSTTVLKDSNGRDIGTAQMFNGQTLTGVFSEVTTDSGEILVYPIY